MFAGWQRAKQGQRGRGKRGDGGGWGSGDSHWLGPGEKRFRDALTLCCLIPGEVRLSKRPCPRSLSPMRTGSGSKSVNVKASYLSAQDALEEERAGR